MSIQYKKNTSSATDILDHLKRCDADFIPALSTRVNLEEYSDKLFLKANRFEAWNEENLIGLVAAYFDAETREGFITNVSVEKQFRGKGIADMVMKNSMDFARMNELREINLEVNKQNENAIDLYLRLGFKLKESATDNFWLNYKLEQ